MPQQEEPNRSATSLPALSDLRGRRTVYFDLRGLLGIVVLAILASHHALVPPRLWTLGIAFLATDLILRFSPPSWFIRVEFGYGLFLFDLIVLTVVLYSIGGGEEESLLLCYLTVFIAALGENVRRSLGIGVVVSGLYLWLRSNHGSVVFSDAATLLRVPLFFVTAVSCGYLAEQLRAHKGRVKSLIEAGRGLESEIQGVTTDLAESERLRRAAEASEARFRDLVQDLDAIVWEMDARSFRFTFVSHQAERILGYPAERWLGELDFWIAHIHPEDRERVVALCQRATSNGRDFDIEYRALGADGRVVWLRDLLRVRRDDEGKVVQLRGVMVDVTELKRSGETLDRLRRQNEMLLTSAGEGICSVDIEGKATFANPAAARMLGWEVEELIGKSQHEVSHHSKPDGSPYPSEECPIHAAFRDGAVHHLSTEVFWRKDGTSFPVEYVSTPIREQGEITGAVVVFKDITERKRADEALRRSEASLANAQRMAHLGDWEYDVVTDTIRWSDEIYRIFGLQPQEFAANFEAFINTVHPEDREVIRKASSEALFGGKPYRLDHRIVRPDGKERIVHEQAEVVFDNSKKPIRMIGTVQDITELRGLQAQFQQAQKMEAVGRLAGGVAHDFNNLLTIITGYSQLILNGLESGDPRREQVEEIKKAGDRAAALTRQLLAFSRRQVLTPQVLDLNAVVSNLEKMLRRLIGEDIELVTVPGKLLGKVKADPSQIDQVIMNLAVNARDAMPDGGRLTLEASNFDVDEAYARSHVPMTPGSYVMLSVTDTGCGMDAKTQAHIFEPFFTTKEKGKGTGLGLATVYGVVKQSGGYIWVQTEPGQGAKFTIHFPKVEEKHEAVEQVKVPRPVRAGSETVLLVEDEAGVRLLLDGILRAGGYLVLSAARPAEALMICQHHAGPIDILVTDVVMPDMSGTELAKRLEFLYPEIKVLYVSGHTDETMGQRGVLEPGIAFLQKPFTPESLIRRVREILDVAS